MIVASLCTIPERKKYLKSVIYSILPLVDKLNIFLNGYDNIPDYLLNDKINIECSSNHKNMGDANKFYWTDKIKNSYHFICDDDIIYNKRYFNYMIKKLNKYNNRVIVSLCGSRIDIPKNKFINYYQSRNYFSMYDNINKDIPVHIIGTGVMCYHTNYIKLLPDIFYKPNMADILLGIYAKNNKISLIKASCENINKFICPIYIKNNIYESCINNLNNDMNTLDEQSNMIRNNYPWKNLKDKNLNKLIITTNYTI